MQEGKFSGVWASMLWFWSRDLEVTRFIDKEWLDVFVR